MNPNSRIFTSTYRVKWLKSKLTQKVKINIDENNQNVSIEVFNNGIFHLIHYHSFKARMLKLCIWPPWPRRLLRSNVEKLLKMSLFNFGISTNFCPIKSDLSGNTFDCKFQVFKNSSKLSIFGIFNQLKM